VNSTGIVERRTLAAGEGADFDVALSNLPCPTAASIGRLTDSFTT
jgi:hypothetical protein